MKSSKIISLVLILFIFIYFSIFPQNNNLTEQDKLRLEAVIKFADNVLNEGRDKYRRKPTPLFADGMDVKTKEHIKWFFSDNTEAIMSDLACQQNFQRTLVTLTNLTGDKKYKNAAKECLEYMFKNYRDKSGLLQWGGHRFIDLKTLKVVGQPEKGMPHEFKNTFPFYDFMYEVNPEATIKFIKAFWNAHVYNWKTLETSRHGKYGLSMGNLWDNEFKEQKPFFETKGLTFLNVGNDLIYSAVKLYQFTGDKKPLIWAKRLAYQYVRARHPVTKLGVYQFSQPLKTDDTSDDNDTRSFFGDRAKRQFGPEFGEIALEGYMVINFRATTIYINNALIQLQCVKDVGKELNEFLEWTREGLAAYYKYAYIPETNMLKPLIADGTDLSNFVLRRDGYYGKKGDVLKQEPADGKHLLSYTRGFILIQDKNLWEMARGIAKANELGDIGSEPGVNYKLNFETQNDDPNALFAVLEIYREVRKEEYLNLARKIGDNIVKNRFINGYFMPGKDYKYANFDAIEPYALLALHAAIIGKFDEVPDIVSNDVWYAQGQYNFPDGEARDIFANELYEIKNLENVETEDKKVEMKDKKVEMKDKKEMIFVKGGTFIMGSNDSEIYGKSVHEVTINDFWIGKKEVTQKEWIDVMGNNPSRNYGLGDNYPVYNISWYEAIEYCNKKSEEEGLTPCYIIKGNDINCNFDANGYRLPTEAEWEYAARGGDKSKEYKYSGSDDINSVSWYNNNSNSKTHPVGEKKPNELGIYDMSGNISEWCWDWYGDYSKESQINPKGALTGSSRILRGGSFANQKNECLTNNRSLYGPNYRSSINGLRIVRSK